MGGRMDDWLGGWVDETQEEPSSEVELGSRECSLDGLGTLCPLIVSMG